jgi:hypothetical protein
MLPWSLDHDCSGRWVEDEGVSLLMEIESDEAYIPFALSSIGVSKARVLLPAVL